MIEKEYTVIANTREDLPALEAEITASSGAGPIPNRSVDIANPRPGSKIQTHFMLTDEEAEALRSDPRVRAVEIPPDQRDDISIGKHAVQSDVFYRGYSLNQTHVNWGLRRTNESSNTFGNTAELTGAYNYALAGTGVDVVIQDSGIEANHPEWEDAEGNSRLQQIDWYAGSGLTGTQDVNFYTDYDGHGTHCAGISAGKTFGWAKNAHIYAQKLGGLEGPGDPGSGISITNAFDTIRIWHNNKTNGRPTVVNMSWGYGATLSANPISGVYRGSPWTWGVDYTDRDVLEAATGVSINRFQGGTFFRMPVRVASVDAEIEDMIADGLHICIAAGNGYNKVDIPTGDDYNNTVLFGTTTYNYHQGSSPYSENAFMVCNIDSAVRQSGVDTYADKISISSTRGPGCNILAPGTDIMSAASTTYDTVYSSNNLITTYFGDSNFNQMCISGTSMASPQVAGLCALYLESQPNLTPAQLQAKIFADSKTGMYDTPSDTDYNQQDLSLMGTPDRILYSRYGNPYPITIIMNS